MTMHPSNKAECFGLIHTITLRVAAAAAYKDSNLVAFNSYTLLLHAKQRHGIKDKPSGADWCISLSSF